MHQVAVGTQITVVTTNEFPNCRTGGPKTSTFVGTVVERFPWANPTSICMTTGLKHFPVRLIEQSHIISVTKMDGKTVDLKSVEINAPSTWEIQGSKGNKYSVTKDGTRWSCTCVAGGFGRHCKHVKQAQDQFSKS